MKLAVAAAGLAAFLLANLGGCAVMDPGNAVDFTQVRIVSSGGAGFAHKTVYSDGTIRGGHLSGGYGAPRVYENSATVEPIDMAGIAADVARFLRDPGPACSDETRLKVEVALADGSRVCADAEGTHAAKALWERLYRYDVGAW